MNLYTNLNITGSDRKFPYLLEYTSSKSYKETRNYIIKSKEEGIYFTGNENSTTLQRNGNMWIPIEEEETGEYLPHSTHMVKLLFLVPQYNALLFNRSFLYTLSISLTIHGREVYLYSENLSPLEMEALRGGKRRLLGMNYYEGIEIEMIDPHYLLYSDSWKEWRERVCDEPPLTNHSTPSLNIVLSVSENIGNNFIPISGYDVCQSALSFTHSTSDYLHMETSLKEGTITSKIVYNNTYSRDEEGWKEYMKETYGVDIDGLNKRMVWMIDRGEDEEGEVVEHDVEGGIEGEVRKEEWGIMDWNGWKNGMILKSMYVMYVDTIDEPYMIIPSNEIMLTKEVYKYLIINEIENVDLSLLDMNNIEVRAINKIVQKNIMVERPKDYKANIQIPIFITSQKSGGITLHRGIKENIAINLDRYKNKVNVFSLKVGDVVWKEEGRVNGGIVFKINGTRLSDDINDEGLYYILDDEGEMVTNGKYTIEG